MVDAIKSEDEKFKEYFQKDPLVSQFIELGEKLLKETNKPNVVTKDELIPYSLLFNVDHDNYRNDETYRKKIQNLSRDYMQRFNINAFEPTIVIESRENPKIIFIMNRRFTRIKSDNVEGKSHKDLIPASIAKNASVTRDALLQGASLKDLVMMNNSPEQQAFFERVRKESAHLQKFFLENVASEEKRQALLGTQPLSGDQDDFTPQLDDDD